MLFTGTYLSDKALNLGMAAPAEYYDPAACARHLGMGLGNGFLQSCHDGTSSVDEGDTVLAGTQVGFGRFAVGTDQHRAACELRKVGILGRNLQSQCFEPRHLRAVVYYVAQRDKRPAGSKALFRLRDRIHHPETETRTIVYLNFQFYDYFASDACFSRKTASTQAICSSSVILLLSKTMASGACRSGLISRVWSR